MFLGRKIQQEGTADLRTSLLEQLAVHDKVSSHHLHKSTGQGLNIPPSIGTQYGMFYCTCVQSFIEIGHPPHLPDVHFSQSVALKGDSMKSAGSSTDLVLTGPRWPS